MNPRYRRRRDRTHLERAGQVEPFVDELQLVRKRNAVYEPRERRNLTLGVRVALVTLLAYGLRSRARRVRL